MEFNFKSNDTLILILLFVVIAIILFIVISKKLKHVKMPNVYFITGAVKTGKSGVSFYLGILRYYKNLFAWHVGRVLMMICKHSLEGYPKERPMLYVNIPCKVKHNRLTMDIIERKVRIPNKSVVIIDEAALFADSMLFNNQKINDELLLFVKLFGHYSHGGTLIFNSQQLSDVHYSIKRGCGRYLYIYDTQRFPFFSLVKAREMVFSDDTSMVNDVSEDLEKSLVTIFMFSFIFKLYDQYCYSCFTDDKVIQVDYNYKFDKKDLKAREIISFSNAFKRLKAREEKENNDNA